MLKQDQLDEIERIERRNAKIKQLLAEGDAKNAAADEKPVTEGEKFTPEIRPQGVNEISVAYGQRKPRPWEDARGRQVRPMTMAEQEEEQNRVFLKNQWNADQEHAAKVKAAEREQSKEIADNRKRREHEAKTNKRPYNEGRFISLEEARRRGLIGQDSGDDGNNWSSPGNESGLFASGRGR